MKDAKRRELVNNAIEALTAVQPRLAHASANLAVWSGPAGSSGGHGSGVSDPTFAQLLGRLNRDDPFADTARRLDQHITTAARAAEALLQIVIAATVTTSKPGAESCSVCVRVRDDGKPHPECWQPIYRKLQRPGRDERAAYCSFCAEFIERYGTEPSPAVGLWHLSHLGSRVPLRLIREEHPAVFEQHHSPRRRTA